MRISETIERSGYFWLPGNDTHKAPGTLRISDGGNVSLEIVGSFSGPTGSLKDLDADHDIERIIGHIEKAGLITLEKCFYTKRPYSFGGIVKSQISVNWAVLGVAFEAHEKIEFDTYHAWIEGLDHWVGLNGITTTYSDDWTNFTVEYHKPNAIRLLETDDVQVEVQFGFTMPSGTDLAATVINHNASLKVVTRDLHTHDYFTRIVGRLKEFLSFALDETVTITSATAYNRTITDHDGGGESRAARMEIFVGFINHPDMPPKLALTRRLFEHRDVAANVDDIITCWLALYDSIGPALNLYFATKAGAHKFLESRFLSLAQALETLHRRTSDETVMPPKTYAEVVDAVVGACPAEHADWLKQKLTYGNEISLSRRIKVLLRRFPKQFGSKSERARLAQMIADTRNYLTHFDEALSEKAARKRKLWVLCLKMEALLQLHLLATLHFSDEQISAICSKLVLSQKLKMTFSEG